MDKIRTQLKEDDAIRLEEQNKHINEIKSRDLDTWSRSTSWMGPLREGAHTDPSLYLRYTAAASMINAADRYFKRKRLEENAILSSDFPVTPEFVRKVSRIGGANSNRNQWVQEWPAQTMHDAVYFIDRERGRTIRGSTEGDNIYSNINPHYTDERTPYILGTGDGVTTSFTITALSTQGPIRPKFVEVYLDGTKVGFDDGAGGFLAYAGELDTSSSSIDYTATVDGAIVFTTAPDVGAVVSIRYAYDSEDATAFAAQRGTVKISVSRKEIPMHILPVGYEFHDFAALYVESTGVIDDLQTELIQTVGDLTAADMDYRAIFDLKSLAQRNSITTWDANPSSGGGADWYNSHAQRFASVIEYTDNTIYEELVRSVTGKMIAGYQVRVYLQNHDKYEVSPMRNKQAGSFLDGKLMSWEVYGAPSRGTNLDSNEILWVTSNPMVTSDAPLIYAVYAPLISELKYPNHITEGTISTIEGKLEVTSQLVRRIVVNGAPAY